MLNKNPRFTKFFTLLLVTLVPAAVFASAPILMEPVLIETIEGDALVTASIGEPSTLVPILATDSASQAICGLVFNGLVKYNPQFELEGDLAESWTISDDGLAITFQLRQGVRWHDGEELTSEDVLFTYQSIMDPKVPTPYKGDFERIANFEVLDTHRFQITYKEAFAPALSSWTMNIIPEHLLEGENLVQTNFSSNPIGTGPFRFSKWVRGDRVELFANKDYFEGRPNIDRYIYRIIPDQATIFLELQAKGLDMASLSPLQYQRMTDKPHFTNHFQRFSYPAFGYTYMGYDLKNPKFSDVRVRQAINYAIDKQEIIEGVLLGLGKIATGPFVHESWAYNQNIVPTPYNPDKSKELLKEAGWEDRDGDGWVDKAGEPFKFTLITNQGNLQRELTAQIIQRRLKEVGIEMELWVLEWSSFIHEFINKRRFEAVMLGWGLGMDPDPYDIWHSSKQAPGDFNFIGYENADVDKLLEAGRGTLIQSDRQAIYHQIHEILYKEQPLCFLYVGRSLPCVNKRFKNVEETPIGIGYNLKDWYVPKALQRYHLRES